MLFRVSYVLILVLFFYSSYAQSAWDSTGKHPADSLRLQPYTMRYAIGVGTELVYTKPRNFGFIRNLPGDFGATLKAVWNKKSVIPVAVIAGSTAGLLLADQSITDGVQHFLNNAGFQSADQYHNLISVKFGKSNVNILRSPKNLNTALYETGQGFPGLVIGTCLFAYGKVWHDDRALSTASQLAESFLLMGITTQVFKRVTGRQSPSMATVPGGKWHLFPAFHDYQTNTSNYDAFPSGHMATLISTLTVLIENYPEHRYIKYIGYPLAGLVGLAMINNGAHWASDYPLAIGLGYICSKTVAKMNRKIEKQEMNSNRKARFSGYFTCINGKIQPGILYQF